MREDSNFVKLGYLDNSGEVYHHKDWLTCIGNGASGFWLEDDCNINKESESDLGYGGYF